MYTTKITRNGQMTLPKKLREKKQIQEGQIILFFEEEDKIVLRIVPVETKQNQKNEDLYLAEKSMDDWSDPIHDDLFEIQK